ncbi:MAG: hypothetical protein Q9214_000166 [Letrouitia sp. 1 TL-2023]
MKDEMKTFVGSLEMLTSTASAFELDTIHKRWLSAQLWHHWSTRQSRTPGFYTNLYSKLDNENAGNFHKVGSTHYNRSLVNANKDGMKPASKKRSNIFEQKIVVMHPGWSSSSLSTIIGNQVAVAQVFNNYQQETLKLAIETPLPSTPSSPQSLQKCTPVFSHFTKACQKLVGRGPAASRPLKTPSFQELIDAEKYLKHILSSGAKENLLPTYQIPYTQINFVLPSFSRIFLVHSQSFGSQRPIVLVALFLHIYYLRRYPFLVYPRLLQAATTYPGARKISAEALYAVIAFHVADLPPNTPRYYFLQSTLFTLLVCLGLILAIELCIVWNGIKGMGGFGAVGQLVPAVIGIGGFTKVVWAWQREDKPLKNKEDGLIEGVRECAWLFNKIKKKAEGGETDDG